MAYKYSTIQLDPSNITSQQTYAEEEKALIGDFELQNIFNIPEAYMELGVFGLDGTLLQYEPQYRDYSLLQNAQSSGKSGASIVTIDPEKDAIKLGYETGDVRLLYSFFKNLYNPNPSKGKFFIEAISSDRTEIRAISLELDDNVVAEKTSELKTKLESNSYFSEFKLNFGSNNILTGLNIDSQPTAKGLAVIIKLYQPLSETLQVNSQFTVNELISDSLLFEITAELIDDVLKVPSIKGPNFNVEATDVNNQPTEFFNFNELFSYPVSNSYYELYSLFNEKSAQIAIDHTDYSDFIHFSSAEERLRNFKYKLDLINSYTASIADIELARTADSSGSYSKQTSGSKEYYEGLITGIINNFDHYDRYLYYESSSKAWPKGNTTRPFSNLPSTNTQVQTWFNQQIISSSNYDNSNFDILTNTIPTFIREDSNNEPYLMFIHMIAQHFDNLWIYFKAVSDKYDADNRLNFGVSKDIVRTAIENFGVKLYSSTTNTDNLFSMFIGETYNTGSELITTMSIATSASFNSGSTALEYLQPVPKNDYEKEIYKRIYHNLPYLLKTKGTERGLRALINCYGIPSEILSIKTFGGVEIETDDFFGPNFYTTSSYLDKIRLDNTGSLVSGSTLSKYASIVDIDKKYTDDQHQIEIGFDISKHTNDFIDGRLSGSFDIDDYIGDPRLRNESSYSKLNQFGRSIIDQGLSWDVITANWEQYNLNWEELAFFSTSPRGLVRLINFFDSSLFRVIKDFVPARSKVDTGIIIKSHKLARSKAKQVTVTPENIIQTGSIAVASVTGSQGGSFDKSGSFDYTTNYNSHFTSPLGVVYRNVTDESPQFNGEFSGSLLIATDGEIGSNNPFLGQIQPNLIFDITVFNETLPPPPACILVLSGSYVGESFTIGVVTGTQTTAQIVYPISRNITTSYVYGHDFINFEYFTIEATDTYPEQGSFQGWYDNPNGTGAPVSTDNPLTIYSYSEDTLGNKFYAYYS